MRKLMAFGLWMTVLAGTAFSAGVRLPALFCDNMVVQRETAVPFWGWAGPGEKISITGSWGAKAAAVTGPDGTWKTTLRTPPAGGPFTIAIRSGAAETVLDNVLSGEVWLCSGQSNMQMAVRSVKNAKEEIAAADYPQIRLFTVRCETATEPRTRCGAVSPWAPCSPKTVGGFSAAAYFFGRELYRELGIPIGLIHSSWGGTGIEAWTPWEFQKDDPVAVQIRESWDQREATYSPEKAQETYDKKLAEWKEKRQKWIAGGKKGRAPRKPRKQGRPRTDRNYPCNLYNAMIAPLVPYALRGVIWYQGEHNSGRGKHYEVMLTNLITAWRSKWGCDFPFYFVQLPNFRTPWKNPVENSGWADIRESFMKVAKKVPGTGMAITVDIGEANNIHPKNKQEVGRRLALLALHDIYGWKKSSRCGPVPRSCEFREGRSEVVVTFDTGGSPLAVKDGGELIGFALTGMDGKTVRAKAEITGEDTVVVSAPEVKQPVMLHYAWAANPTGVNLCNRDGLPATPFRFGGIPPLDCFARVLPDEAKKWTLVYAFDPLDGRLEGGRTFVYAADHSRRISSFRKVAYFLALQEPGGAVRYVFVAMDPFTDDVKKIGVPAKAAGARFQQNVTGVTVKSNVEGVATGDFPEGCNIEFWDCNYGPANAAKVKNASSAVYDFGDAMNTAKSPGYGSMQIHNWKARQCILCFNKFSAGRNVDIGIGNAPGKHPDWTFTSSGKTWSRAEFKILVLP